MFISTANPPNYLQVRDNRALSKASEDAKQQGIPLIAIFILSPQLMTEALAALISRSEIWLF
jgi:hypothetical protein